MSAAPIPDLAVGQQVTHPDGYLVQITRRFGPSFWYWRRVNQDGGLAEAEACGYGHELRPQLRRPRNGDADEL